MTEIKYKNYERPGGYAIVPKVVSVGMNDGDTEYDEVYEIYQNFEYIGVTVDTMEEAEEFIKMDLSESPVVDELIKQSCEK